MAQDTYIARKGYDADFADLTANSVTVNAQSGVTSLGVLVKLTETVAYDDFTDNEDATGTYALAAITAVTGFAGDTSATITIGDGTDVDRYHTGTPSVFATAANGVAVGSPSGVLYHDAAKTPTLIVTSATDFSSVSAGSVTVELFYLT